MGDSGSLKDIEDELKDFVKNGFKPGFQVGLKNFDDIFSTYTGLKCMICLTFKHSIYQYLSFLEICDLFVV